MAEVVHSTGKPASMISLIVERASRDARNEDFTAAADAGLSEVPIAQRLFTERRLRRLELNLAGETQCPHEASEVLLRRLEELQATFMARVAAAKPSGVSKPSGVFKSAGIAKRKSAPSDDDDGSTAKSPAKPTATSPDEVAGDALCRVRAVSCDVDDMDLKKGLRKKWRIKLFSSLCPEGNDAERRVAAVGLEAAAYDVAAKAGKAGRGELYEALLTRFVDKAVSSEELRTTVVAKKHSPRETIDAVAKAEAKSSKKKRALSSAGSPAATAAASKRVCHKQPTTEEAMALDVAASQEAALLKEATLVATQVVYKSSKKAASSTGMSSADASSSERAEKFDSKEAAPSKGVVSATAQAVSAEPPEKSAAGLGAMDAAGMDFDAEQTLAEFAFMEPIDKMEVATATSPSGEKTVAPSEAAMQFDLNESNDVASSADAVSLVDAVVEPPKEAAPSNSVLLTAASSEAVRTILQVRRSF